MKSSVCSVLGTIALLATATIVVVALTGAGAGATQLIAVGFLAIAIFWQRFNEPPEEISKGPTDADRSKGSR